MPRSGEIISFTTIGAARPIRTSSHVEAGWDRADDPLAEIQWLETLDKSSGVAARYVGFADLTASDSDAVLDRLSGVRHCVGVRQMLSWHPTESAECFALLPGIADEANIRRGVALLGRHDQLLELMLYPSAKPRWRAPSPPTFIVNHCGSPGSETEQSALFLT